MPKKSRTGWIRLALLAAAFAMTGGAQDPVVRVESQLVLVDVVVNGGATTSLTRDDFRIFDNGQQQQIAVFETDSGEADSAGLTPLPAGVTANRRDWRGAAPSSATVILIDRINTPTEAQVYVNQQVQELLKELDAKQRIALYELRSDGLRILHDFTADPAGLAGRVALEPEHSLALESSARRGGFESDLDTVGLDPRIEEIRGGNTGFGRRSAGYFLNDRTLRTSTALEIVARRLEGLRGRRNLVWLSGRFPFSFDVWARADLREEVEETTMKQISDVAIRIGEANIAIYPVDVRGPGGEGSEVAGIAREIARASGGRSFRTNAVSEAVHAALSDSRMVYTLGFYPSQPSKDGGRRSIRVEAGNSGLDLLYRPNYTGFGGSGQPVTRVGVADLLSSPLDATNIGLTAMAAPAQGGPGTFELVILADIADLHLVERDGRREGAVVVGLVFRAEDDGTAYLIPPSVSRIRLTPEEYATLQKTGLVLQRFLNTEGRSGAVRVAIQDQATGRAGSLWVPIGTKK